MIHAIIFHETMKCFIENTSPMQSQCTLTEEKKMPHAVESEVNNGGVGDLRSIPAL